MSRLWTPLCIALCLALFVTACGKRKTTDQKKELGEAVDIQQVCMPRFAQKRVEVEGFVAGLEALPCTDTCPVRLRMSQDGKETMLIALVKTGDDSNAMTKLTKEFKDSDVQIRSFDGKKASVGSRVRLTGKRLSGAGFPCYLKADWVEVP